MKCVRPRRRGAFTLVEVLLATVLAAMLLVALWSMLSMYSKVFEGGHARTEQSQLARILLEQITTDLQAVRQAPPTASPIRFFSPAPGELSASSTPTGPDVTGSDSLLQNLLTPAAAPVPRAIATASLRPAGLFGTDTFLQIDVLQPAVIEPEHEFDDTVDTGAPARSRAEELKTVIYSFEERRDPSRPSSEPIMHLLRREMDWEQAHPSARGGVRRVAERVSPLVAAQPEPITDSPERADLSDAERLLEDDRTTIVPEVIHFAMRYFDGTTFSDEWDSIARQGLPTAVEVTMQLRSHDEPDVVSDGAAIGPGVDAEKVMQWKHPLYRLLIPLTAAGRAPGKENSPIGEARLDAEDPLGADTNGGLGQP